MDVQLLPKQMQFMRSMARDCIFVAGIGSGKTKILALWAIYQAASRRRHVLLIEPNYGMVKRNLYPALIDIRTTLGISHTRWVLNKSDHTMTFPGGGCIWMGSADNPDSLRGPNMHDGGIDEAFQLRDDEAYKILIGRTRLSADAQRKIVGTPTPIQWARELSDRPGVELIRQTTRENTFLPQSFVEDLKSVYGEDSLWYRQEVLGEFVEFGTGMIETAKIKIIDSINPAQLHKVRAWDFAHTDKKEGDWTASVLLGVNGLGDEFILDVTRYKGEWAHIRDRVCATMRSDGGSVTQVIEDTLGGKVIRSELTSRSDLRMIPIIPVTATKDKVTRALAVSSRVAMWKVYMLSATWNKDFRDECNSFPVGEHDDQVDALAHAHNALDKTGKVLAMRTNIY